MKRKKNLKYSFRQQWRKMVKSSQAANLVILPYMLSKYSIARSKTKFLTRLPMFLKQTSTPPPSNLNLKTYKPNQLAIILIYASPAIRLRSQISQFVKDTLCCQTVIISSTRQIYLLYYTPFQSPRRLSRFLWPHMYCLPHTVHCFCNRF